MAQRLHSGILELGDMLRRDMQLAEILRTDYSKGASGTIDKFSGRAVRSLTRTAFTNPEAEVGFYSLKGFCHPSVPVPHLNIEIKAHKKAVFSHHDLVPRSVLRIDDPSSAFRKSKSDYARYYTGLDKLTSKAKTSKRFTVGDHQPYEHVICHSLISPKAIRLVAYVEDMDYHAFVDHILEVSLDLALYWKSHVEESHTVSKETARKLAAADAAIDILGHTGTSGGRMLRMLLGDEDGRKAHRAMWNL